MVQRKTWSWATVKEKLVDFSYSNLVFGTSMLYEVFERLIFAVPWLMVLVYI